MRLVSRGFVRGTILSGVATAKLLAAAGAAEKHRAAVDAAAKRVLANPNDPAAQQALVAAMKDLDGDLTALTSVWAGPPLPAVSQHSARPVLTPSSARRPSAFTRGHAQLGGQINAEDLQNRFRELGDPNVANTVVGELATAARVRCRLLVGRRSSSIRRQLTLRQSPLH